MDVKAIPSLQDLALEASLEDILATLKTQCCDYQPPKAPWGRTMLRPTSFSASQAVELCGNIRFCLHYRGVPKQIR